MESYLRDRVVLVTGAAGSIGSALVEALLLRGVRVVRAMDFNEASLFRLQERIQDPRLRMLFGDVRDFRRVEMAMKGCDCVLHTAALKNIAVTEFNPFECLDVNVGGTRNVVEIAMRGGVQRCLLVSSDKATHPTTLYGMTKFIGEKLFVFGAKSSEVRFSAVRLPNIYETNGNVFELWGKAKEIGRTVTLYHQDMSRYFMHMHEAVPFILDCLEEMEGGEIFIPKVGERKMLEFVKEMGLKHVIGQPRYGEKIREELMTPEEKMVAAERADGWVLRP